MAGSARSFCMVLITAALIVAVAPPCEAITGCSSSVASYLSPCAAYLAGTGSLGQCCTGMKGLSSTVKTVADRQSLCSCMKSLGVSASNEVDIAALCGINISFNISPSIDC